MKFPGLRLVHCEDGRTERLRFKVLLDRRLVLVDRDVPIPEALDSLPAIRDRIRTETRRASCG